MLDRLWATGRDARGLGGVTLAAVGPATAAALAERGLRADLVPDDDYGADALADALAPLVPGRRALWATCPQARPSLAARLAAAGAEVRRFDVYRQVEAAALPAGFAADLAAGRIDWALLGSGNLARRFADLAGEAGRRVRCGAISGAVAAVARGAGLDVAAVAGEATWAGLARAVAAVVDAGRGRGAGRGSGLTAAGGRGENPGRFLRGRRAARTPRAGGPHGRHGRCDHPPRRPSRRRLPRPRTAPPANGSVGSVGWGRRCRGRRRACSSRATWGR